jgi:beta-lactamase class D
MNKTTHFYAPLVPLSLQKFFIMIKLRSVSFVRFTTLSLITYHLFACSPNNVTEDESLKKYFDSANVTGSFGLFDNGQGHFTIYNLKRFRDTSYTPASTFKIVNSLIGIQTGIIRDEKMVIKWDSVKRWNPDCKKDLTLE